MRTIWKFSTLLIVGPVVASAYGDAGGVSAATQSFLANHPGTRAMFQGERMVAIYGPAFANDSNVASSTDDFVGAFLQQNASALGVDNPTLVLKDSIVIRNGTLKVYTYTQQVEGLPVYGSVVKIPVRLGPTERIGYIGIRLVPPPPVAPPAGNVTAPQAVGTVTGSQQWGHLTVLGTPEAVIYEAGDESVHRVWRFAAYDDDESYLFFVDTSTGGIIGVEGQVFDVDVHGTVSGHATRCCDRTDSEWPACCGADNPLNPPAMREMVGVQVRLLSDDAPACPDDSGPVLAEQFAEQLTSAFPAYQFNVPDQQLLSGGRVSSRLVGQLVTVLNCENETPSVCGSGTAPDNEALACLAVSSLGGEINLEYNPSPFDQAETAQINAFWVAQDVHDWFKLLQPTSSLIDKNLLVLANTPPGNAFYVPAPEHIQLGGPGPCFMGGEAGICNNFAAPDVVAHEYGHFIMYNIFGAPNKAFHEGAADAIAALRWNTERLGQDLYVDRTPREWKRNLDDPRYPRARLGNSTTLPPWCSDITKPHCEGLALSQAFWDMRKTLIAAYGETEGLEKARHLLADFLFVTVGVLGSPSDSTVLAEVLAGDDDNDGDIGNGTMHSEQICSAFAVHGWECPSPRVDDGSIVVDWLPVSAPDPIKGTDYFVDFGLDPPHVTLKTTKTTVGGVPTQIDQWIIGRVKDGQPADLGRVSTDWNTPAYNITVQLGDPLIAARKCKNVGIIDIPSQDADNPNGATTWSNIRLELGDGEVSGRAQCFANSSGQGGRISGRVAGRAQRVNARDIGIGDGGPDTLDVQRILTPISFEGQLTGDLVTGDIVAGVASYNGNVHVKGTDISDGNISLTGYGVPPTGLRGGSIVIDGPYAGIMTLLHVSDTLAQGARIEVAELRGTIHVLGPCEGDIRVLGDIIGSIVIDENMTGDVIANADGIGGGSILGPVTISGEFNGNICGDNISAGAALPANIHIASFGPNARICGVQAPESCRNNLPTAPTAALYQSGVLLSNRFLSFSNPNPDSAIRVRLMNLQEPAPPNIPQYPPPDFASFENGSIWVGKPSTFYESSDPPSGPFRAARLQCTPFFHDWNTETVVHVTGAEIVPSSAYEMQVVKHSCEAVVALGSVYSQPPLTLTTRRYGDVEAPFNPPATSDQPNSIDLTVLVNKVKGLPGAPVKAISQLQPNLPELNANVSALDIVAVVDAVKQFAYPFSGPCPCPSTVTCNQTVCGMYPSPCANNGLCVRTCTGGSNGGEPCINNSHCLGGTCGPGFFCRDKCGRCTP